MAEQSQDVIQEFLLESYENLSRLDRELIGLETDPGGSGSVLPEDVFRTIHTIKGTCGFLAFPRLEGLAHQVEDLLSQVRQGARPFSAELVSLLLESCTAIRAMLGSIESTGKEGPDNFEGLRARLAAFAGAEVSGGLPPAAGRPGEARGGPVLSTSLVKSSLDDVHIRVGVGLLDKLMDLVGELVLTRNQILQFNADREDGALNAASQRLNLITTELQEKIMKTRMQPIGVVWNKLPRVVRDLAVALGKQVRLETEGDETELDRTIIEAIRDPLVHIVRNACDHGIEPPEVRVRAGKPAQGRLTLRAYHEGGQVNIEIADDGAGIDPARIRQAAVDKGLLNSDQALRLSDREVLNLVFHLGFSTARQVTNVSGRGVGMDVVRVNIEKIGGVVDLSSRPGEGVTVKLKIPLTLAIIPGLVVLSAGERFVIPQVSLLELVRLEGDRRIERVHGTAVYRRRGSLLPVAFLNEVLGLSRPGAPSAVNHDSILTGSLDHGRAEQSPRGRANGSEAISMVVLQAEERQFGLVVDGINDTQEIVVKPLGAQLKGLSTYAGATIMGDGRIALILDVVGLGQRSGVLAESRDQARTAGRVAPAAIEQQRVLLFRAGSFERLAVPLSLVARLEEFPRASIERAGGCDVVQYRGRILRLVSLGSVLEAEAANPAPADPVQVIVFSDGSRSLGMVVDGILDIAEEKVTLSRPAERKGLLGSAVVGKRMADFLDVDDVLRAAAEDWREQAHSSGGTVLLADSSAFARGLIRGSLEIAGYRVREASHTAEVLRELEQNPADLVLAALDLPPEGAAGLETALHARPEWVRTPVLALAESAEQARTAGRGPFSECQWKQDRQGLLESVARLAAAVSGQAAPAAAGEEQ